MKTTDSILEHQQQKPVDPRIDSPHIKVIYPYEPNTTSLHKTVEEPNEVNDLKRTDVPIISSDPVEHEQAGKTSTSCTHSLTDAIKAHSTVFLLIGLGILAAGYFIGKIKV